MSRSGWYFLLCGMAYSQDVAILQRGDLHIQGFGGFTLLGGVKPVSTTAVSPGLAPVTLLTPGTNASIGIQMEYNITRLLGFQADYSYLAGGTLSLNQDYVNEAPQLQTRRVAIDAHSSARIGNASLVVRFPLQRAPRLVPYGGVGAGVSRTHFELKQAVIGREPGTTFSGSTHENDLIGSVCAGGRYYFTERLGIAMDLRLFAGPGIPTLSRLSVAFFYKAR
jgi:hypothetical protein